MKGYLLDTSICVALFRGSHEVERHMNDIGCENSFITDVVFAELKFGAYKSERTEENLRQIEDFISSVKVIPFAESIDEFAKERLRLWRAGKKIEDFDLLIGCAAKAYGLTMVTHNIQHFNHIAGLITEDWII